MKYLTKAQYDILKCIDDYIKTNNYSPTYRELAILSKRTSTSTIYKHIQALLKKNYISMQERCSRTIKITTYFDESYIKK